VNECTDGIGTRVDPAPVCATPRVATERKHTECGLVREMVDFSIRALNRVEWRIRQIDISPPRHLLDGVEIEKFDNARAQAQMDLASVRAAVDRIVGTLANIG